MAENRNIVKKYKINNQSVVIILIIIGLLAYVVYKAGYANNLVFWAASVVEICLAYLSYKIKRSFKVWLLLIDSFATLTLGSINVSLRPILASYLVGLAAFFVIGNLRRGLRKSGIDYKTSEVKKIRDSNVHQESEDFDVYIPTYLPEGFEEYGRDKSHPKGFERWNIYYRFLGPLGASKYLRIKISKGPITDPIGLPSKKREHLQKEVNGVSISIDRWVHKPTLRFWHEEFWNWGISPAMVASWNYQGINFRVETIDTPFEEGEKIILSMIN